MQNIIKTTMTDLRVELANLESFLMSKDGGLRPFRRLGVRKDQPDHPHVIVINNIYGYDNKVEY